MMPKETNVIVKHYYDDEGKLLKKEVYKVLHHIQCKEDPDDFIDLANVIFVEALNNYDGKSDFNGLLFRCLENKFKTHLTRMNRIKRTGDRGALSLDEADEEGFSLLDRVSSRFDLDKEIFGEDFSENKKISSYINKLSKKQKQIAYLIMDGLDEEDIMEKLNLNSSQFSSLFNGMKSFENVKILF